MKYMIGNKSNQGGFTILYSLLVISLLISISLGIFDISLRDFSLSQSAAESQVALFAADAGMECALYYDLKFLGGNLAFATSTVNPQTALTPPFTYTCGVPPLVPSVASVSYNSPSDTAVTILTQYLSTLSGTNTANTEGPCAIVTITKTSGGGNTSIDSRGYNICTNTTATTRRVERGLHTSY